MANDQYGATRNKTLALNTITGVVGRVAALGAPLIAMPMMLKHLGPSEFGVWMTAASLTSMAMFLDLGVSNATVTRLARSFAVKDMPSVRSQIASSTAILTAVALVLMLTLAIVYVTVAPSTGALSSTGGLPRLSPLAVACFGAFILTLPCSLIYRIMQACQYTWLSSAWQTVGAATSIIACLYATRQGAEPWEVVAAYSYPPVLLMIAARIVFFYGRPEASPGWKDINPGQARSLLKVGSGFFILSALTSLALNIDNALLAHIRGPAAVAEFAVPAKLASLLGLLVTTLFAPLWAASGEALARGDHAWVQKTTQRLSVYGALTMVAVGLLMCLMADFIFAAWMDQQFPHQELTLAGFTVLYAFMACTSPYNMVLNATGTLALQVLCWTMYLVLSVTLKYVLLHEFPAWILPAASAVTYAFLITPWIITRARKIMEPATDCACA